MNQYEITTAVLISLYIFIFLYSIISIKKDMKKYKHIPTGV